MENKKTIEEPQIFIKQDSNGNYYLDVQMSDDLRKEIRKEVLSASGAIVFPA